MFKHYVYSRYFLMDILSGFPYDYVSDLSLSKTMALFKTLKTVKILRLLRMSRFSFLFNDVTKRKII